MGYHARLSTPGGLSEYDVAQQANDGSTADADVSAPIAGCFLHNGQAIPFTLDTGNLAPEPYRLLPEHIAIGALFCASLIAAFWHVLG